MGMTDDARKKVIAAALDAIGEPGVRSQSVRIPEYKNDAEGPFPVVDVPVDAVIYNPKSHRIRAQLESHPKAQIVKDAPFSDEAQDVIAEILRNTDRYPALCEEMRVTGQKDFGIVTSAGLLVNANTRLAALREVDSDYITVAVLPSNATEADIRQLELELQVQVDWKQEYTFTNELLFIWELVNEGNQTIEKIARSLNQSEADVEQAIRLLSYIREIQGMGSGILLEFFDDQKQALQDLDDRLQSLATKAPGSVEVEKQKGYLVILLRLGYQPMRGILRDGVVEDHLIPRIAEIEAIGPSLVDMTEAPASAGANSTDDGTDLLGGDDEAIEPVVTLEPLNRLLAGSFNDNTIAVPYDGGVVKKGKDDVFKALGKAVENAVEADRLAAKQAKTLETPEQQVRDARAKTQAASKSYVKARGKPGFKLGGLKQQVKNLKREVAKLEELLDAHERGEGNEAQ